MSLLAVDAGRSEVEVMSNRGIQVFPSVVSPVIKELNNPSYYKNDLEIHMDGKRWYVGDIALREGRRLMQSNFGESKVNDILRVHVAASAIYAGLMSNKEIDLGILVPVNSYTKQERHKLVDLLKGTYAGSYLLVKEEKKEPKKRMFNFEIKEDIIIAQEGVAAFWSDPRPEDTQTLDFGAQTINFCFHEARNGECSLIEDFSGTINDGWETLKGDNRGLREETLAELVAHHAMDAVKKKGWNTLIPTQIFGGVAHLVFPHIQKEFHNAELADDPRNGNVKGLYAMMEEVVVNV